MHRSGKLLFTREGAHSRPRILFHEDITGKEITTKLLQQVKRRKNITILEYTTMKDILEDADGCEGIVAETKDGEELINPCGAYHFCQRQVSEDVMSIRQIFRI